LKTFHEPRAVEHRAHRRLIWELPVLKTVSSWIPRRTTNPHR